MKLPQCSALLCRSIGTKKRLLTLRKREAEDQNDFIFLPNFNRHRIARRLRLSHRYVLDHVAEEFRGLYLRLRDVQHLEPFRILDEDVAVPQIENNNASSEHCSIKPPESRVRSPL